MSTKGDKGEENVWSGTYLWSSTCYNYWLNQYNQGPHSNLIRQFNWIEFKIKMAFYSQNGGLNLKWQLTTKIALCFLNKNTLSNDPETGNKIVYWQFVTDPF